MTATSADEKLNRNIVKVLTNSFDLMQNLDCFN